MSLMNILINGGSGGLFRLGPNASAEPDSTEARQKRVNGRLGLSAYFVTGGPFFEMMRKQYKIQRVEVCYRTSGGIVG